MIFLPVNGLSVEPQAAHEESGESSTHVMRSVGMEAIPTKPGGSANWPLRSAIALVQGGWPWALGHQAWPLVPAKWPGHMAGLWPVHVAGLVSNIGSDGRCGESMNALLIDDHALFREGLALLLRPLRQDLSVREAGSCEQAFAMLEAEGPADLVLIDLEMPGMHGLEGIATLRRRWPDSTVVALSSVDDRDTVLRAIDAGAMGFIPKSATAAVLIAALGLILARGVYLPPSAFLASVPPALPNVPRLPAAPMEPPQPGALAAWASAERGDHAGPRAAVSPADLGLTPRQSDVLFLILQGKPAKLIERELALSTSTIKAHTSAVLRALNVTTRTQAVVAAGRLGLSFEVSEGVKAA